MFLTLATIYFHRIQGCLFFLMSENCFIYIQAASADRLRNPSRESSNRTKPVQAACGANANDRSISITAASPNENTENTLLQCNISGSDACEPLKNIISARLPVSFSRYSLRDQFCTH